MGAAKIIAELTLGDERTAAALAAEVAPLSAPELAANKLAALLVGCVSGMYRGRLRLRIDDAVSVAATGTLVATGANIAAGEYLEFVTPGGRYRVTAVASGAADGDKTFNTSATDNTVATNIRQAINTHPDLRRWLSASGGTNNVIITAKDTGTVGNSIEMVDGTVNGVTGEGLLTGGKGPAAQVTATIGCVLANTDADDTVKVGGVTFTAKAGTASGAEQFNLGASNTAMGDNLVAKINAHPSLLGIVSGVNASGTITLTYACDPRAAINIALATSDADGLVITQPSSTLTLTNSVATRSYNLGVGES